MDKANRAAQLNPVDALKGLQDELRTREEKGQELNCKDCQKKVRRVILSTFKGTKRNVF